jgi:putative ABC transport system permease protein
MSLAWRFALRDLRGGLLGLRLLAVCLFLGVAALAAVGSLSSAIVAELSARGTVILGGDLQMEVVQRVAEPAELEAFAKVGTVSETVRMRAMASSADGLNSVLVELKGVDAAYPLFGKLTLEPRALAARPAGTDVAIAPALAERLSLKVGDKVRIGEAQLRVIGIIAEEPDRVGEGFTLGPVALVDQAGIAATQLVQPGSLYTMKYRIKTGARDPARAGEALVKQFPSGGWEVRDRANGAPGTRRFIERLGQFLALVGLTSLIVAGIGVGNGVTSYLEGKRSGIATMKALGATSNTIFLTYLFQIMIVAIGGIIAGLAFGALSPWAIKTFAGDALPVQPSVALYPVPLLISAAFGMLIAVGFALVPLARARSVTAASLFRAGLEAEARPALLTIVALIGIAAAIAALAIFTASNPLFAAIFLVAAAGVLIILTLVGAGVRSVAAKLPRPKAPLIRLALANLHRPGAQTSRLVVALGLGLTLFATLAVIESNLAGQIERTVPKRAPNFFVLDIPLADIDAFRSLVARQAPGSELITVPSLRGPVVAVGDQRVSDMKDIPDEAWVLRGDRGLTYAADLPEGSRIVSGKWWPKDYAGPPLVSLDVDAARALGIKVGDTLTISVLGVEIVAEIASLREINWDTLGFNFAMIYSPGVLEAAPHSFMATIAMKNASNEGALNNAITQAFASTSLIRVKDVITQVGDLLGQLATAVRLASLVAVAAGIAVLIGAIAASRRARIYDAVILKTLGATRRQILVSQAIEYAGLAIIVSLLALLIGAGGGWYVVTQTLGLDWSPDWIQVLGTTAAGAILVLGLGLIGSLPALAARPAEALRTL